MSCKVYACFVFPGKLLKYSLNLVFLIPCDVTGTFRCTFCLAEVEEDESVCPDARTLVARFNEQIEPIYALLRETEDVNLSHDLLEPEPTEIPALKQRSLKKLFDSVHLQAVFTVYMH